MKINDVISQLQELSEESKELPFFVCDDQGVNLEVKSISLYDENFTHSQDNPLGANFDGTIANQ